jgi:hypothetical protein
MRGRDVMRDAVCPGSQRTSRIVSLEASPQLKVDVLAQVTTLLRVRFVGARQSLE